MKLPALQVSPSQLFWILLLFEVGVSTLLSINPLIKSAGRDAWIAALLCGLLSIALVFVATRVTLQYPKQTLVEYSQSILGKWLGRLIVVLYLIHWYMVIGIYARQAEAFLFDFLFQQTPMFVLFIVIFFLVAYLTYQGGIESIGRCSEFLGPVIIAIFVLSMILNFDNLSWHRLLPVFATSGTRSILQGCISASSSLAQSVLVILMVMPFVNNPQSGAKRAVRSVLVSEVLLVLTVLFVTAMFGENLAARLWYPYFEMTRFVNFMDFIQNVDAAVVVIWFGSVLIRLSVLTFIASIGTAQLFGLKDWKTPVLFIVVWSFVVAMLPENMLDVLVQYPHYVNEMYVLPILTAGIPMLLWTVSAFRQRA